MDLSSDKGSYIESFVSPLVLSGFIGFGIHIYRTSSAM